MKKRIKKTTNLLPRLLVTSFVILSSFFIYRAVNVYLDQDSQALSNQVWCQNCQTYHDRATAEQEQNQKLIWCVNCNKYHAPSADE